MPRHTIEAESSGASWKSIDHAAWATLSTWWLFQTDSAAGAGGCWFIDRPSKGAASNMNRIDAAGFRPLGCARHGRRSGCCIESKAKTLAATRAIAQGSPHNEKISRHSRRLRSTKSCILWVLKAVFCLIPTPADFMMARMTSSSLAGFRAAVRLQSNDASALRARPRRYRMTINLHELELSYIWVNYLPCVGDRGVSVSGELWRMDEGARWPCLASCEFTRKTRRSIGHLCAARLRKLSR